MAKPVGLATTTELGTGPPSDIEYGMVALCMMGMYIVHSTLYKDDVSCRRG